MSAADCDFSPPFGQRIEFHFDRVKLGAIGGGSTTAGILAACALASRVQLDAASPGFFAVAVGLVGAAVLSIAGLSMLMHAISWRGPAVVIDRHGIHDRRSGAVMTPWSSVHDIRMLDRHGRHIGIDTSAAVPPGERLARRLRCLLGREHAEAVTVIDTYFLRSPTGSRVLDFVMPITALTPADFSETPVSEQTLSADAAFARGRLAVLYGFLLSAAALPALATALILI